MAANLIAMGVVLVAAGVSRALDLEMNLVELLILFFVVSLVFKEPSDV